MTLFSFSTLSHDPSETQNLSISSLYFAPSYHVHSWSSFLLKLPHKTCVICEGMHSTLRAQVIFDIPSSLPSLTRHVMCFKLDQREANSLLAAQWILILLAATAEQWLQVHSIAKDFTPLWGSVGSFLCGKGKLIKVLVCSASSCLVSSVGDRWGDFANM